MIKINYVTGIIFLVFLYLKDKIQHPFVKKNNIIIDIFFLVVLVFLYLLDKIQHPFVKKINNLNPFKTTNVFTYIEPELLSDKRIQLLNKNSDIPVFFDLCIKLMQKKFSNLIILTPYNYLDYVDNFPIKMGSKSDYSLKQRIELLSAYVLEKNGGLFLSPGTIVYDKKDILTQINNNDVVTFGDKTYLEPSSMILGCKYNSEFIKLYKEKLLENNLRNSEVILKNLIVNNEFTQKHYSDGTLNSLNNRIFISDYLGNRNIKYKNMDNLSLISVNYDDLLNNLEYKWFMNLSYEQFTKSNMFVKELLKRLL